MQLSVSDLQFTVRNAADHPAAQTVSVISGGQRGDYVVSTGYVSTAEGWLSATPEKGVAPSSFSVSADPHGLANGTYLGFVKIASASAEPAFVNVTLTIGDSEDRTRAVEPGQPMGSRTVSNAGATASILSVSTGSAVPRDSTTLALSPTTLNFPTTSVDGPNPPTATISVTSGGAFSVNYWSGCGLFGMSPLDSTAPDTLTVTAFATSTPDILLQDGNYTCDAVFRINNATQFIYVSLHIVITPSTGTGSVLAANPTQLSFSQVSGGTAPASQNIQITTTNTTATSFTVSHGSSATWLTVSPTSGSVTSGSPASLSVSVNSAGLTPSSTPYTDTITITGGGTSATVSVSFTFSATASGITANPTQLSFTQAAGAGSPPSQTILLSSPSASATSFTVTHGSAATWLSVTPTSGNVSASSSMTLTVSVSGSGLTSSTTPYADTIVITGGGSTINVSCRIRRPSEHCRHWVYRHAILATILTDLARDCSCATSNSSD